MADQPSPTSLQPLLSEAEQREAARQAERWATAQRIAAERPDLDVGDIYHALRNLELPPTERLRRGLTRVRVRPHAR